MQPSRLGTGKRSTAQRQCAALEIQYPVVLLEHEVPAHAPLSFAAGFDALPPWHEFNIACDTRGLVCRFQKRLREIDRETDEIASDSNRERCRLLVTATRKQQIDGVIGLAIDQACDRQPESICQPLCVHAASRARDYLEFRQVPGRVVEFDLHGPAQEQSPERLARDAFAVDGHNAI